MVLKGIYNSVFSKSNKSKGRPMLNEIPFSTVNRSIVGLSDALRSKRKFWDWFKTRPEFNAPISIRVDDTISEIEFYDVDGKTALGRNKLLSAQKFVYDNQLYERFKSMQYDRIVTGSGFLWKGSALNQRSTNKDKFYAEMKQVAVRESKKMLGDINTREATFLADKIFLRAMDEDVRKVRKIDYIASSTVAIDHDEYEVLRYVQNLTTNTEIFMPDEIVHIPLMRIDGKVDGFTPVESCVYEAIMLWAIKENMMGFFRNGNWAGKIFVLPDEVANSENHKWLVTELMNKSILENRHGHIVLTGNVDVQDIERKMEDMQHKDLALYMMGNVCSAVRVPLSRVENFLGKSSSGTDAGGLADSGYWSTIESDQRTLEMHLNQQIFNDLGFSIKFKRKNLVDEVKEAQAQVQWVSKWVQANNLLRQNGIKIKKEKLISLLNGEDKSIHVEDTEEMSEEEMMGPMAQTASLNKQFISNGEMKSKGAQKKAEVKSNASKNNPKGKDMSGY